MKRRRSSTLSPMSRRKMRSASRALVYRAAWCKDTGRECGQAAAMAKLFAGECSLPRRQPRRPGLRRIRLHLRLPRGTLPARCEDYGVVRGNERNPPTGDCTGVGGLSAVGRTSQSVRASPPCCAGVPRPGSPTLDDRARMFYKHSPTSPT